MLWQRHRSSAKLSEELQLVVLAFWTSNCCRWAQLEHWEQFHTQKLDRDKPESSSEIKKTSWRQKIEILLWNTNSTSIHSDFSFKPRKEVQLHFFFQISLFVQHVHLHQDSNNFSVVSCAPPYKVRSASRGGQGAGANWGKAGILMWNLIEMCRSKVLSGAERWLCSVLNDCSQQCFSASSLQADNYTASNNSSQTRGKVTLPLHH